MRFLSLCSGIEAASVAWTPLGWEAVAFSEIDPFPSAVLAHRFPDVPNLGDMTKYEKWPEFESIDLICAGTPCQSFSQAGLRKGLDDPRGNLMLTFGHILAKYRPKWFVWENVPGVLSSNIGRDFAAFLGLVTGQSVEPPKDGWRKAGCLSGIDSAYGVSWRVLDAQFTRTPAFPRAVPQRRQRVFVVGYLGDWRRAATVLVDGESLSGNPAPGRSAGQGFAGDARTGIEMGGGQRVYDNHAADARYNELNGVCATVTAKYGTGGGNVPLVAKSGGYTVGGFGEYKEGVGTLRAQGGDLGGGSETLVAEVSHTLTGDGFDASEDETGRGTPIIPEIAQTIMASEYKGIGHNREDNLIAFTCKDHGADAGEASQTVRTHGIIHLTGEDYANAEETDPDEILSVLRRQIGEKAFTSWGLRIVDSLQQTEILQPPVLRKRSGRETEQIHKSKHDALPCTQDATERAVSTMRQSERLGCPPQGWKPSQQHAEQFRAYLSLLSLEGASQSQALHDLWRAAEGIGVLREALCSIQEMGRSVDGEGESVRGTAEGYRTHSAKAMCGTRMSEKASRKRILRDASATDTAANANVISQQKECGMSLAVRRLIPL